MHSTTAKVQAVEERAREELARQIQSAQEAQTQLGQMWAQQLERSIEDLKAQLAREKAGRQHVEKLLMEGERVMTERENELSQRAAIEQAGLQRMLQDAREQKESLEEMISVLNRRLDAGEGRERVLKSRVELLQGRLTTVFGGETPMPWEEIEVIIRNYFPPLTFTFVTTRAAECCRPTGLQIEIRQGPKQHRHRGGVGGGENKLEAACDEARRRRVAGTVWCHGS
jgi:hypothetical protein